MAKEEEKVVEQSQQNETPPQAAAASKPIFLNNQEFSQLLNVLLVNTKFFVATEIREKPKYEGDATIYVVNVLVNSNVININSDLVNLLKQYSNNVQMINNPDIKNHITFAAEIYVKDPVPKTAE
jgi:hypothetical protein